MNTLSKYIITTFIFFLLMLSLTCKKTPHISIEDVLSVHQWRKTLEAVYNGNNEFEKYTFNFETAANCEKNSYMYLGRDGCYIYNLCSNDYYISYAIRINNDSIYFIPYDYDTTNIGYSRFIEYYNERSFVLRYDTMINDNNKFIKETYMAFDKK